MFKKVLLTIGLLLMANVAVYAQGTLKGTITDAKTGEPLPFVNIVVKQNGQQIRGGQTDFDGMYTIKPLDVAKYDIEVSNIGYAKYIKTGVQIKASGFTIENVQMTPTATNLEEVVIVDYKAPIIEIGDASTSERITSDDIEHMTGNSVDALVATVGGVSYNDGGTGTARGQDGMVKMQGGVRKHVSVDPPKELIAEINVILGGTPASIGEAIGGVQIITLKPPSPEFHGMVKYDAYLNYQLSNSLTFYIMGPLWKKKSADGTERSIIGYRLNGVASYTQFGMYRAKDRRYQMVDDELVKYYEQNPLQYNPLTGEVNYTAESGLYADNFVEFKRLSKNDFHGDESRVPNLNSYSIMLQGALDIRFSDNATLALTADYYFGRGHSASVGLIPLNMSRNDAAVSENNYFSITADFTQRFAGEKEATADATMPESKKGLTIQNIMYNITGSFSRSKSHSYNENFGSSIDDIFKYGYIGQFVTEKERSHADPSAYDYQGIQVMAREQDSWRDNITSFTPTTGSNSVLANYTSQLYGIGEIAPYLTNFDNIRMFKGLVNGESPSNIFGLYYLNNVGVQSTPFSYSQSDFVYLQAKISADVKNHQLEMGFQFDRSDYSSYNLRGAYSIWTLMRQEANKHIQQLDKDNPNFRWEGNTLYIDYDRLYNAAQQEQFDIFFRTKVAGLDKTDVTWLDIDRYSPEDFVKAGGINMFSADELFNQGTSYVDYYGYDHTGKKYNGKNWSLDDFYTQNAEGYRYLPSFTPTYMAGYVQDQFRIDDLIFNIGVRVDFYDGNQYVLKDPYLLYESKTVKDLGSDYANEVYTGAGDDWVVYVDDPEASHPTITGYRNGSTWYNASGVEVSSPSSVAGISGKATPYRTAKGQEARNNNTVGSEAFEDYETQIVAMPRFAFSFPIGDKSQFKASYDIIARRPSEGAWQAPYLDYLYMSQKTLVTNPNLKPEKVTNYELGFDQMLNKTSGFGITAYYKETRDLVQITQYAGADPNDAYYSYDNLDFMTIKGFTFSYDLRQSKNIRINANYTLQYAEGTGLSTTTMQEMIKEGYTTLKMLNPISDDRRHEIKGSVDFRYGSGSKYNGPTITRIKKDENGEDRKVEVKLLEDFGVNFLAVAQSGRPYTRQKSHTQQTIVGSYRGARLPWSFFFDVAIDKSWTFKVGKHNRPTALNAAITIKNLFDTRNVAGVFAVTGNPADDGYLTDPETQTTINSYLDPQSFRDLYNITYLGNAVWNYTNPRSIRLTLTYSF